VVTIRDSQSPSYRPSEANRVIQRFDSLTPADQQAILDFLPAL